MLGFNISTHWSSLTAAFYVMQGIVGMCAIYFATRRQLCEGHIPSFKNKYIFAWWFLWVFFAVFRLVQDGIGGGDAVTYINYFNYCNSATITSWFEHVGSDLGFKWLNKFVRYLFVDYHFYFLIIYGFMAFSYISFLKSYAPAKTNYIPYLLSFFLFLRSYSSIRSNLAIAFIAFGCVFMIEQKWKHAYVIAFAAIFFHKAAVLYAAGVAFCHFFSKRKLTVKKAVVLVVFASLIARVLQSMFLQYASTTDMNGAYEAYASRSINVSFIDGAWKIAFEQMLLAGVMFFTSRRIGKNHSEEDEKKIKLIWLLCIFDIILIPVNFTIGSWRGYEFFYLARIVMWGECLYQIFRNTSRDLRFVCQMFLLVCFASWMVFRVYATYMTSNLSPYVFYPLYFKLSL